MARYYGLCVAMLLAFASSAQAHREAPTGVALTLSPVSPLVVDQPTQVIAHLTNNGKPLTFAQLGEVHTRKLHLLVIDPGLGDYHHLHPTLGSTPGDYVFTFTPHRAGSYRAWADITLARDGSHHYVAADMGIPADNPPVIDKTPALTSDVGNYHFALKLDGPAKAGEAVMGQIIVTHNGKPVTTLQPVMGAFAHVVGFSEDYHSIMHIHPMGTEPTHEEDRGGPTLDIHIEPATAGFVKLFAQVRINDQDIFAPFGLMVLPASAH